jgi:hypothetical protein
MVITSQLVQLESTTITSIVLFSKHWGKVTLVLFGIDLCLSFSGWIHPSKDM